MCSCVAKVKVVTTPLLTPHTNSVVYMLVNMFELSPVHVKNRTLSALRNKTPGPRLSRTIVKYTCVLYCQQGRIAVLFIATQ